MHRVEDGTVFMFATSICMGFSCRSSLKRNNEEKQQQIHVLEGEQDQVTINSPIIIFQVNIIKHLKYNSFLFKKKSNLKNKSQHDSSHVSNKL